MVTFCNPAVVVFFSHCSPVQVSWIVPSPVSVKQPETSVVLVVLLVLVVVGVVVGAVQGCKHTPNVQLPDVALQAWGWSATQRAPEMEAQSASV